MKHFYSQSYKKQGGAVLALALIFLMLFTLLGTTAIRTTTFDEKMAANSQSRVLALQGAESAIAAAEAAIQDHVDTGASLAVITSSNKPAPEEDTEWNDNTNSDIIKDTSTTFNNTLYSKPRYVVEEFGTINLGLGASGKIYRITAYSTGANESTVVVLEKLFFPDYD